MTEKKKHAGGRPTKLTVRFIEAAEAVLNKDINAIIHTDEDLLMLINELLDKKERIHINTLCNWKSKTKEGKDLDELGEQFLCVYKKALSEQKADLFKSLKSDDKAWQRFAWIIERKFGDWNIRQKVDVSGNMDMNVKASQDVKILPTPELRTLIGKILNK